MHLQSQAVSTAVMNQDVMMAITITQTTAKDVKCYNVSVEFSAVVVLKCSSHTHQCAPQSFHLQNVSKHLCHRLIMSHALFSDADDELVGQLSLPSLQGR